MTKTTDDYIAEAAEQTLKHDALLEELEVPTYEDRRLEAQWVKSREEHNGDYAITGTSGWTAGCSKEVYDLLIDGKPFILETQKSTLIAGWIIDGKWYDRKSDQEFARERAEWLAKWEQEKLDNLEKNRVQWTAREAALPDWIRTRLENFRAKSDGKFDLEGWGYELIVAELAVEYFNLGDVILDKDQFSVNSFESEAIKAIAQEQGTSGNQHGVALALAKAHLSTPGHDLGNTVSALAPLTGDAFYEKN